MRKGVRARSSDISDLTARRLSVYLRCLSLLEAGGVEYVSSREMADQFQLNSAQFRKDLAYFGEFGVRGKGYRVEALKTQLVEILGLDREVNLAIVGAGNLGQALADYGGFNSPNFSVVALFDTDARKVGTRSRRGAPILDLRRLDDFVNEQPIDIVILAVPDHAGQQALDRVAAAGVQAVLNFVPVRLKVPAGVRLKSVDLKVQVEALVFRLARRDGGESAPARSTTAR